jgi:hypothetical protein
MNPEDSHLTMNDVADILDELEQDDRDLRVRVELLEKAMNALVAAWTGRES